jgi:hypothetical protein
MIEEDFRPISEKERAILQRLLKHNFRGHQDLERQLEGLLARQIDEEGSLRLKVVSKVKASIPGGVAVEGRYSDSTSADPGSPHVDILLRVGDGQMRMLERYKDDSSPIGKEPDPAELQLFSQFENSR